MSGGEEAGKERPHGCDGDNGAAVAIPRWGLEGSPPSAVPKQRLGPTANAIWVKETRTTIQPERSPL